MKKKTIEKIPYLRRPGAAAGKGFRHTGAAALEEVEGEDCFILDIYGDGAAPEARVAVTPGDYGTWFPESGEWHRHKYTAGCGGLLGSTRLAPQDERLAMECFGSCGGASWQECLARRQEEIDREKKEKGRRRRQQALEERQEATPGLPEAAVLEYADRELFGNQHYLFYRKKGNRAAVACSACGAVSEGKWKAGDSYESWFERTMQEPREHTRGRCPSCGAHGEYKAQGRMHGMSRSGFLFLGQKYKGTGMVFRYLHAEKRHELEQQDFGGGPVMAGAREVVRIMETARVYFEKGKKPQRDYYKYNPYTGECFWDDCNLYGLEKISVRAAPVMPETYEEMEGTILQYSALREYIRAAGTVNPAEYAERYLQIPQMEMLVKMRLYGVVKKLVECRCGIVADEGAARADKFLGIRKEKLRLLIGKEGDVDLLKVLQLEKRRGACWTDGQAENLAELGTAGLRCGNALRCMTIQKMLNRIAKYAGCGYGTQCSRARNRLEQTAQTYFDYIDMRIRLGYDMADARFQKPADLNAAHDAMVLESSREEADKRVKETEERFPMIRGRCRMLRKRYCYEDGEYSIRPAASAEEIVLEGRILHHCVGGGSYLAKHDRGESAILFLRHRDSPDTPFVTVEMGEDARVIQWHGKNNSQPDREKIQKWLDAYAIRLKCGGMAAGTAEAEAAYA